MYTFKGSRQRAGQSAHNSPLSRKAGSKGQNQPSTDRRNFITNPSILEVDEAPAAAQERSRLQCWNYSKMSSQNNLELHVEDQDEQSMEDYTEEPSPVANYGMLRKQIMVNIKKNSSTNTDDNLYHSTNDASNMSQSNDPSSVENSRYK